MKLEQMVQRRLRDDAKFKQRFITKVMENLAGQNVDNELVSRMSVAFADFMFTEYPTLPPDQIKFSIRIDAKNHVVDLVMASLTDYGRQLLNNFDLLKPKLH
jgi:hypothetical protein